MSITKSAVVLALCVLSQTVQGAEERRVLPNGPVRATTPRATVRPSTRVVSFADASKVMAPYKQWMIGANNTGLVYPQITWDPPNKLNNYNLKGKAIRKFLQYEKPGAAQGMNLGWTDNASASTATESSKWFFSRPVFQYPLLPIRYGERISLSWGNGKKPYVKVARRTEGVNLDWSQEPSYEWAILGGRPGENVKRGKDWVIIYNLRHKRPLIYFDRTRGGDIGWPESEVWGRTSKTLNKDVSMEDVIKALLGRFGVSVG